MFPQLEVLAPKKTKQNKKQNKNKKKPLWLCLQRFSLSTFFESQVKRLCHMTSLVTNGSEGKKHDRQHLRCSSSIRIFEILKNS